MHTQNNRFSNKNVSTLVALIVALVVSASYSSNVAGQGAQCRPCQSPTRVIKNRQCASQNLTALPFEFCCNSEGSESCPDFGTRKCRYIELENPMFCSSGAGAVLEWDNSAEQMAFGVEMESDCRPGECCSSCECHGDPHCVSFQQKLTDFIICDARDAKKGCAISPSICAQQIDMLGGQCQYSNVNGGRCLLTGSKYVPFFSVKDAKRDLSILTDIGDRGTIIDAEFNNHGKKSVIRSSNCALEGEPFPNSTYNARTTTWTIGFPVEKVGVQIKCKAKGTFTDGSHLDINLVDAQLPKFTKPPTAYGGFCATSQFEKGQATTANTDAIQLSGCGSKSGETEIRRVLKIFYPDMGSRASINTYIKKWCFQYILKTQPQAKRVGRKAPKNAALKQCFKNAVGKGGAGMSKTFCAAQTLPSKNATDCVYKQGNGTATKCVTCTNDIADFDWQYAINIYFKPRGGNDCSRCVTISQLPDELAPCDMGTYIQYFDTDLNTWVNFKAIPAGKSLCKQSGLFTQDAYPFLFRNRIRFAQCGRPFFPPNNIVPPECPGTTLEKECSPLDGLLVKVNQIKLPTISSGSITTQVDDGKLVCKGGGTDCFNTPFVECGSCFPQCPVEKYQSPCPPGGCDICPIF